MNISDNVKSKGKTPWKTLGARIYTDIKDNPNTRFIQASKRPAKFYLKDFEVLESSELNNENFPCRENDISKNTNFNERDLHPLLVRFLYSNQHFKCNTKTIYHENSNKRQKGYNEWLHPDLVGIYFPFDDYSIETRKLQEAFKISSFKLFSFEMKIKLNFTNLREYYFQAVSNSSWAHEGYLVVLDIEEDGLLYDELRRLNNAFGIGVIKLNPMEIEQSEILFREYYFQAVSNSSWAHEGYLVVLDIEDDELLLYDELRRLNNAFGIGVIKLNPIEIEQSEILFPSRERDIIDMDTVDRLAEENKDFKCFMSDIIEDIQVGKVKSTYDKVYTEDEYERYIAEKRIKI